MRLFACLNVVALVCGVAFGQGPDARPKFEIADVHVSARSLDPSMSGGLLRAGRYQLRDANMVDLIRTAYGVEADNVIGGPSWLEMDRFDVIAKAPPATSPETVNRMLQALLAERFGLVVHNDTKPMPAFVLTVGKGKPKLKETEGSGNTGCQPQPQNFEPGTIPYNVMACHNMTMEAFAPALRGMAGGYLTSPVVDLTGLKGSWDFTIRWTGRGALSRAGADGISIFDAVDKQLGLKLEPQKVPTPVIVVDRVNQKPTPNPPGVTTSLPPAPPTEFEVADLKPSQPGAAPRRGGGFMSGGRIDLPNFPIKGMLTIAWDIPPDAEIIGAPKWLDTARYDLIAKASTTSGPANGQNIDFGDLRMMLRALLADRFKLVTHYEDRPVTAYSLVAAKPKLKKADPSNRTGCKTGPAPISKDTVEVGPPPFQATCQNITMAQFAEKLQSIAPVYLHYPVLDSTGIEGAWDFTFTFSFAPPGMGGGRRGEGERKGGGDAPPPPTGGASAAGVPEASEPSAAISLFDALNKQLGLKLEAQKRPVPVLVIDHIEEKPTEN